MAFELTTRARQETRKTKIEPQLVLEIEGVPTLFGAVTILQIIRIGDPDLFIGDDWVIGGLREADDQADIIGLEGQGTSTKIDQQIQPDKGSVSSVSSMQIGLIDRDLIASRLISPGVVLEDILGAKAKVWLGFQNTAFKDDYLTLFSGVIDDIESGAGVVKINIAHPEQLKRQEIFIPQNGLLASSINSVVTTIPLIDASAFPEPVAGPDGSFDTSIRFYVKIEDEIIRYTGKSGNNLTGAVRGQLATVAATHTVSDPVEVESITQLEGQVIDLALKVMLSGKNGFYLEDLAISRYLHPDPFTTVPNSIFFDGVDLTKDYGITEGDYATITGATAGANNCSAKVILQIIKNDTGSYMVIDDVTFVEELTTSAVVAVRSQFDTLGDGLALSPDQVDVTEHVYWRNAQLATYQMRFEFDEPVNGKDFLDKEIYKPIGAFSIPRQGRCSMGYHVGPLVASDIPNLDRRSIKNPHQLKLRRTISRNFYNTIVFQFDRLVTTGKFISGFIGTAADSRARIKVGTKALAIPSKGLRRTLGGTTIADQVSNRLFGRYKFAAEFFERVQVLFKDGFMVEPGDNIVFDPDQLQVVNTENGTRDKPAKIFGVINRSIDIKTGDVTLAITDINFDGSERYGTISPSTLIASGSTTTALAIEDSFGAIFPGNEARKWESYLGLPILVHSEDWSFAEEVTLLRIDPANRYRLLLDPATPLSSPPPAGYIIDVGSYPETTEPMDNALYKAAHVFLSPTVEITSGTDDFTFDVGVGDVSKFVVGEKIRVHNADFSDDSGEVEIESVVGTTITVATSLGFTPTTDHVVENLGFTDGGKTYRLF